MAVDGSRIDALFANWDRENAPGCAVGVVEGGDLVYCRGFGLEDLETGVPIGPESRFYIASVSKQFTAATAVLLAQDGHLSLDDDVRAYFPELHETDPPVTIRHLIHHTSGLRDFLELWALAGRSFETEFGNEDGLALLARQRGTNFPAGTQHVYCNSGYKLLAELPARTVGRSLRQYADEVIFQPLGMARTFYDDDNADVDHRVQGYEPEDGGGFRLIPKRFTIVGSGGLVTTVQDLARWDANFYDPRVGGPEFVRTMLTPGVLADGTQLTYACGLSVFERKGLPAVGHSGGMLGFRTDMVRFPEQRLAVIVLGNRTDFDASEHAAATADACLEGQYPLAFFAGTYRSEELDCSWTLAAQGADLVLSRPESLAGTVQPAEPDRYLLGRNTLAFDRQGEAVTGFVVEAPRAQGIRFERAGA